MNYQKNLKIKKKATKKYPKLKNPTIKILKTTKPYYKNT